MVKVLFLPDFGHWKNVCRYVKSKSEDQLRQKSAEEDTDDCKPEARTPDGQPIVPCGLIAWSLFNDTYKIKVKGKHLKISKKNIAWQSDQTKKFGSDVYPKNFQAGGLIGGAKLNESIPVRIFSLLNSLSMFILREINNNLCCVTLTSWVDKRI